MHQTRVNQTPVTFFVPRKSKTHGNLTRKDWTDLPGQRPEDTGGQERKERLVKEGERVLPSGIIVAEEAEKKGAQDDRGGRIITLAEDEPPHTPA